MGEEMVANELNGGQNGELATENWDTLVSLCCNDESGSRGGMGCGGKSDQCEVSDADDDDEDRAT